jgi:hypothetical protein
MILDYRYIKFYNEFIEPDKKYNIFSCSIFRLINNYKNENMYTEGLHILLDNLENMFPDFYLRIYYDNSVIDYKTPNKIKNTKNLFKPLFDKLRSHPKVQMIRYEMNEFKYDDIYHKGLVGTIPRLYPLFDTEYNKNINLVIVSDIDLKNYELETIKKNLYNLKKSQLDFFYRTRLNYELAPRFQILTKYFNVKFPIMAGTIINKIKFPLIILDDFFKCILNKNLQECEYYKKFDNLLNIKHRSKLYEYKYGIDEILTIIMKEYLYKNKIKHLILIHNNKTDIYYDILVRYKEKEISENIFRNTLKYLLKEDFNNNKSLEDNYKIIDNIIYFPIKDINTKLTKDELLNRTLQLFYQFDKNELSKNDYAFTNNEIKYLRQNEFNYYIIDYINKFTKDNIQKIDWKMTN